MRTARGAAVSVRPTKRAPRQRLTRRSKGFQLCLTRVLRERNLAVRGEDTRMFGLLCAGMRQPAGQPDLAIPKKPRPIGGQMAAVAAKPCFVPPETPASS